MDYKIEKSSQIININLPQNEGCYINKGLLISKSQNIKEKSVNKKSLMKKLATEKETFVMTEVISHDKSGVISISGNYNGSVKKLTPGKNYILESNSFICVDNDSPVSYTKKNIYSKQKELKSIIIKNNTDLFISGKNNILSYNLNEEQQMLINENYLLAIEENMSYDRLRNENDTTHLVKGPGELYLHSNSLI